MNTSIFSRSSGGSLSVRSEVLVIAMYAVATEYPVKLSRKIGSATVELLYITCNIL